MGLRFPFRFRSLAMLLLLVLFFHMPRIKAQTPNPETTSARALDSILQDYAYRAFVRPRTGIPYNAVVPSNLSGIQLSAMRLRSGSLFRRGVRMYKEFRIPIGVTEQPYVERLVLVYQKITNQNQSTTYYPLPGYTYLAPILGILAYDASNLSAKNLPELQIRASGQPISIQFEQVRPILDDSVAKCVWFDLHGRTNFTNVVLGNTCLTFEQGHFSIVVESTAPSGAPLPPEHGGGGGNKSRVWIIVGSVIGGLGLFILFVFLIIWVWRFKKQKKMRKMEKAADAGEALSMTTIGNTKAPAATTTRTQPTLETEYVP